MKKIYELSNKQIQEHVDTYFSLINFKISYLMEIWILC